MYRNREGKRPFGSSRPYQRNTPYTPNKGEYNNNRKEFTRGPYKPQATNKTYNNQLQLWMGDLDPSWDEDFIIRFWNSIGEAPLSVKIIRDKNDPSPNPKPLYCFVTFANQPSLESALSKNGVKIPDSDKRLKLNIASGGNNREGNDAKFSKKQQDEFSLMVNNLDLKVTESQLFELFNGRYPNSVRQVRIMVDPTTGESKGYGYVKFNSSTTQNIASREMNGVQLNGKSINLGAAVLSSNKPTETKRSIIDVSNITLPQQQPALTPHTNPFNTTLKIEGLAGRFTEDEVVQFFFYGDIIFARMSDDNNHCTIKYRFREDAEKALSLMNHRIIYGSKLSVTWGEPKIDNPRLNKKLEEQNEIVKVYGQSPLTRFDTLSKEELKLWEKSVRDVSEPVVPE